MYSKKLRSIALALSLTVCAGMVHTPGMLNKETNVAAATAGFSLTTNGSSWGDGFSANMELKNELGKGIEDWTLYLQKENFEITSMWCATYKLEDGYYVIRPESWAQAIGAGNIASFGFNGTGTLPSSSAYKVVYTIGGVQYTYDSNGSMVVPTTAPTQTPEPTMTPEPSKTPVVTTPTVTQTPDISGQSLELDVSKNCTPGTYSSDFSINGFTFITGGASWTIDKAERDFNGTTYTYRAKSGGRGTVNKRAIRFSTSKGGTFTVLAMSGGSTNRNLTLNYNGSDIQSLTTVPNQITKLEFSLPAGGTYVLYPSDDNVGIYYMKVNSGAVQTQEPTPTVKPSQTVEPTKTPVPSQSVEPTKTSEPTATTPVSNGDIYVSPNGSGNGTSVSSPMSFEKALTTIKPGKTIYCLAGTYSYNKQITIAYGNNGQAGMYKTIRPYNGAVVFDFSKQNYGSPDTNARGIQLEGNYWHFYDIKITGAADNGMLLAGSYNIIEKCQFDGNRDTGLQISRRKSSVTNFADWPSYNLVKNSTSCNNMDPATGENADGFAAKLTCGQGNVFDGCISYNNVDDGWDLYAKSATGPIGVVTIKNCIAFRNGETAKGVFTPNSDGNGFKLGGAGVGTPHVVTNCIAFENRNHGFTDNNNPTGLQISDCTSFNNARDGGRKANFQFDRAGSDAVYKNLIGFCTNAIATDKFVGTLSNSVYYTSGKYYYVSSPTKMTSGAKNGTVVSAPNAADFESITAPSLGTDFHKLWRNPDGSIKLGSFLKVKSSSRYYNSGAKF